MAKKSTDPCRAERAAVAKSEAKLAEMEERLPEASISQRRRLKEQIRTEKLKLRGLRRQLTICENAH